MKEQSNLKAEPQIIESAQDARQGITGFGVRYVLIFGLCGVIVTFLVIFLTLSR